MKKTRSAAHDVEPLHPTEVPPDIATFRHWALSEELQGAIERMGITVPSPIQRLAIQPVLDGRDVIAKAETGTGKTLAFGAPMMSKIDPSRSSVLGLVLCPTRELAEQDAKVLMELGKARGVKVALIVGGEPMGPQIEALKSGAQVVVGTPGRILDLYKQRFLSFPWTEFAILDEADVMLEIGFIDDVKQILSYTPDERQTLLFSATFPPELLKLAREYTKNPAEVATSSGVSTVDTITQSWMAADEDDRALALIRIIEQSEPSDVMLVFCDRRTEVDRLMRRLERMPFSVKALHGGYDQAARFRVMSAFRTGEVKALVATDVASRGLDVKHVTHVINYGSPQDITDYTHRIGRTGRAGRTGFAVTLVSPRDLARRWKDILNAATWDIPEVPLPGPTRRGRTDRSQERDRPRRIEAPVEAEVAPVPQFEAPTHAFGHDSGTDLDGPISAPAIEREPREDRAPRTTSDERPARTTRSPRGERAPRTDSGSTSERAPRAEPASRGERAPRADRPRRDEREPREARAPRAERAPGDAGEPHVERTPRSHDPEPAPRPQRARETEPTTRARRTGGTEPDARAERGVREDRGAPTERPRRSERATPEERAPATRAPREERTQGAHAPRAERAARLDDAPHAPRTERAPRVDRPARDERPPRAERAPVADPATRFQRPERDDRPGRGERAPRGASAPRTAPAPRTDGPARRDGAASFSSEPRGERGPRSESAPRVERAPRSERAPASERSARVPEARSSADDASVRACRPPKRTRETWDLGPRDTLETSRRGEPAPKEASRPPQAADAARKPRADERKAPSAAPKPASPKGGASSMQWRPLASTELESQAREDSGRPPRRER